MVKEKKTTKIDELFYKSYKIISNIRIIMQIKEFLENYKVKNSLSNKKKEDYLESCNSDFGSDAPLFFEPFYIFYPLDDIKHDLFIEQFFIALTNIIKYQNEVEKSKSFMQSKKFIDEFMKNSFPNTVIIKKKPLKKVEKLIDTIRKILKRVHSYFYPSNFDKVKYIAKKKYLDFVKKRKSKAYHKRFRTFTKSVNKDVLYRSFKSIKKYFDKIVSHMMNYKISYILLAILVYRFIYVYQIRKSREKDFDNIKKK